MTHSLADPRTPARDPRRRGAEAILACCAILSALPGCTWYATEIFASPLAPAGAERVVIVVNYLGEQGERFAVYESAPGDYSRWRMVGHYAGHVRAATVRDGLVWAFFDDALYRVYPLPEDGAPPREGPPARAAEDIPADGSYAPGPRGGERLPFEWTPRLACTDHRGGLWVVGTEEGRIVTARLPRGSSFYWKTDLPPKVVSEQEPPAPGITLRAHAARELYVFWHVRAAGGDGTRRIRGARLHYLHRDPTLPGAWWNDLPDLETPADCVVDDFCVAPSGAAGAGEIGVVARCREPRLSGWMRERMFHARLVSGEGEGKEEWTAVSAIPGTSEAFRFGQIAGTSWVRWGTGGLLLTSNTQRVRVIEYGQSGPSGAEWRLLSPAPWFVTYLPEIQVSALLASALLLVVTGCGAFLARLSRLRKSAPLGYQSSTDDASRPAPLLARVFAASIDLMIVGSVVVALPGTYSPPPSPVLPGMASVVRQLTVLTVLVAYGTAMEATVGATLGKMALGLGVVGPGGEKLGLGRALARNVFRLIETGAVGLAVILVTDAMSGAEVRRRFGDMAAGSTVIVTRGGSGATDEEVA